MKTNQADYPVRSMCRVLGLSPSGYYAWVRRPPSARAKRDAELVLKIRKAYDEYRQEYGRPRLYAELKEAGEVVGEKRVGRLMKQEGIWGASRRRRGPKTTRRNADARPVVDLVEQNFTADGPDQLWVADITYIPASAGFLYLAVVLDAWSRRVIGWAMATHLRTELVLDALNMAVWQRRPERVIHHSDQGRQYTSIAFGLRCREVGVRPSRARSATRTTTRSARASSRRSSASFSTANASRRRPRRRWPSSTSSRASTTRAGGTPLSAKSRRSTSNAAMPGRPPRERPLRPVLYSPRFAGEASLSLGRGM